MNRIFHIIAFFLVAASIMGQHQISGIVINIANGERISFANIFVLKLSTGTACNENGEFTIKLPSGTHNIKISAVGYESEILLVNANNQSKNIVIKLKHETIKLSDDVVVYGVNKTTKIEGWLNSTDDIMQKPEGVSLQRRANFALEPSIRGMSAGQIGVVVDGMKIFSACIDRMDPVTAYIEVENLKKMEISKGSFDMTQSASVGGTINMITKKADFSHPLAIQAEMGYESVSKLKRLRSEINISNTKWAARGTFSIKNSSDYYAGKNTKIENSGYRKNNYTFNFTNKFNNNHSFEFAFIGDNAYNIGYPVLLMDATKALSQIYRLEHKWNNPFANLNYINSKIYYNRIDHWMDDYNRDVTQRPVMTNMYMPMFGNTKTVGAMVEFLVIENRHSFKMILDFYRVAAFADMTMISVFDDVSDMYLINIGDAVLNNSSATLDYNWVPTNKLRFRSNLRYDYSMRDIHNEDARRLLEGFWKSNEIEQTYNIFSFSGALEYELTKGIAFTLAIAQSERLPTHIENYGFYLYNYTDDYFYTGNPTLKPELSRQIEFSTLFSSESYYFKFNAYYNNINNYISGLLQSDEFKIFTNISSAYITGAEISGSISLMSKLKFSANAAYAYGYNREYNEPLPMIPPLEGRIGLQFIEEKFRFSVESRFASKQTKIANTTTTEDRTAAFIIFNFRGQINLWNYFELKFGVENITDKFYNEHLAINNLPSRGRNFYTGLSFLFD
ncbi:MAG: TonB-dependent receptor [Melioribacteraceae bacterium]|nr:TonB-dependent receptor [Melioribacteraceae bacterium]